MKLLDEILEKICDTRWHSFDEIKKNIFLSSDKLNEVLCFLEKQEFINKRQEKIRITCRGLKFLGLKGSVIYFAEIFYNVEQIL